MNFALGLVTSALEGATEVPCRQEHFRLCSFRPPHSSSGASLQTRRPIDWSNLVYVKAFQPMLGLANDVASQPVGKPDHEDSSEGEKE